jgi:hypothetical protein
MRTLKMNMNRIIFAENLNVSVMSESKKRIIINEIAENQDESYYIDIQIKGTIEELKTLQQKIIELCNIPT